MTTYLHNDKEKFYEAMMYTHNQTNFPYEVIEKDYYVTLLLKLLSEKNPLYRV